MAARNQADAIIYPDGHWLFPGGKYFLRGRNPSTLQPGLATDGFVLPALL
jgi:hypothetical protein